jgi:hypothetical protein
MMRRQRRGAAAATRRGWEAGSCSLRGGVRRGGVRWGGVGGGGGAGGTRTQCVAVGVEAVVANDGDGEAAAWHWQGTDHGGNCQRPAKESGGGGGGGG